MEQTQESPIWEMHYEEQLNEAELIPPINGFEEMITLTKQGKLWNFPIDNEQGRTRALCSN
jgi:small subunit ribosomal protein S31